MIIAGGIIQLLVLLLPVILGVVALHNSAASQQSIKNEDIDEDIAKHNAVGITDKLNTMLGQLQDSDGGNKR